MEQRPEEENPNMRAFAVAIALILCFSGFTLAQAPKPKATTQQAARSLPKPSPAELRRCALPSKVLNAVARSACKGLHEEAWLTRPPDEPR
jgi:hypothetical protein